MNVLKPFISQDPNINIEKVIQRNFNTIPLISCLKLQIYPQNIKLLFPLLSSTNVPSNKIKLPFPFLTFSSFPNPHHLCVHAHILYPQDLHNFWEHSKLMETVWDFILKKLSKPRNCWTLSAEVLRRKFVKGHISGRETLP